MVSLPGNLGTQLMLGNATEQCALCNHRSICLYQDKQVLCKCVEGFTLGQPVPSSSELSCTFNNPLIRSAWVLNFSVAMLFLTYIVITHLQIYLIKKRAGLRALRKKLLNYLIFNSIPLLHIIIGTGAKVANWDVYVGSDFLQTYCLSVNLGIVFAFGIYSVHRMCRYIKAKGIRIREGADRLRSGNQVIKFSAPVMLTKPQFVYRLVGVILFFHLIPPFITLKSSEGFLSIEAILIIWVVFVPPFMIQIYVSTNLIMADLKFISKFNDDHHTAASKALAIRANSILAMFRRQRRILLVAFSLPFAGSALLLLLPSLHDKVEYVVAFSVYPLQLAATLLYLRSSQQFFFRKVKIGKETGFSALPVVNNKSSVGSKTKSTIREIP